MAARDKFGHAAFGALTAIAALALTGSPWVAASSAAAVGLLKEAWDATGRGTVDPWDFIATLAGGALVAGGAAWT